MLSVLLKIAGLLVLVAAGAIGFTLHTTSEMITVVERFQAAAVARTPADGLALLSKRRRGWGPDALSNFWTVTRLDQAGEPTWQRRAYQGGHGRLVGIAPLPGEGQMRVELQFRHRAGQWHIDRLLTELAPGTPPAPEAAALFAETRRRLAETVREGSYAALLRELSSSYQQQMTTVGLERLLRQVAARSGVLTSTAQPAGPLRTIFDTGLLDLGQSLRSVHGRYDLRIMFAYQEGRWKLDGLRVDRLEESP